MPCRSRLTAVLLFSTALLLAACQPKTPPAVESITAADQVEIKYRVAGQGEPALVFVHCWTCNRDGWARQAEYFAGRHRVVQIDLAGHGESGHGRQDYRIEAFGGDVAAVVDRLGLKQVVLIGHSMGGPVAVEATKRLGDRVVGVVGVDTFYTGFTGPKNSKQLDEMLKPFEKNYAETAGNFMRGFFAPDADPAVVTRITGATAAADPKMAVSALRNTLEWYGRNNPAALEALGPRLRNINANPKGDAKPLHPSVTLVAGAGHFIPQEKPAAFNRALETLLAGFPTAGTK